MQFCQGVLEDSNAQSMAEDDFSLVDIVIGSLEVLSRLYAARLGSSSIHQYPSILSLAVRVHCRPTC